VLKGNLSELPLGTLLQTLATAKRDGVLQIATPWWRSQVALSGGLLFSAEAGRRRGWQAVELLAGLRSAPFVFDESAEPPSEGDLMVPMDAALTKLLAVSQRWSGLVHIPSDWSLRLFLGKKTGELQLTPAMLHILGLLEDGTVAKVLESAARPPLEVAEALDALMKEGIIETALPVEVNGVELLALSFYGQQTGTAFLDSELYQEWLRTLAGPFSLLVSSPRGQETELEAAAREGIKGRVMLNDKDLRKLKAARGVKLTVRPLAHKKG